jgi:hypothetical protein
VLLLFFIFINSIFMPVVMHPRKSNTYPWNGSNHVGAVPSCAWGRPGKGGASSPASVVRNKTSFQPPWRVSPAQRKTTTGSRSPIPFPCSNAAPRRAALYVVPAIAPECESFVSSIHSTRLGGRLKCRALSRREGQSFPTTFETTLSRQSQTDPLQLFLA